MGTSDTLRSVIDAGRSSKRLDELSSARVIGKIALQIHAAQQKAGQGKAVGPVTPSHIRLAATGEATLELGETTALGYSSPEQVAGAPGDRRSDVFSLGAVLWETLTYARLFDAMNDAAVRLAVQEREIVPPSEINANVPAELSAICMRALARNPTDRYQSLKAMAVEIEEFLEEAGYEDNDNKIAQYLATMNEPPKQVKIAMAPLKRAATATPAPPIEAGHVDKANATQPPPTVLKQPAAPTLLGAPPKQEPRPKSSSGAALAAALANAGQAAAANGTTSPTNGATAPTSGTHDLPPARFAATAVGVPKLDEWQDSAPASVASSAGSGAVAMTPLPPVLPGAAPSPRNDKQTIVAGAVPPPKATVDAKHAEAKQPALLVDAKPPAEIVDTPPPGALETAATAAVEAPAPANEPARLETMTTLVDTKPLEIEVPKLVDGKLPDSAAQAARAASVVSLPGRAESKADVLAGWGWGTDKHNAIAPDGYADDDYDIPQPNQKKTLMYVLGGGLALAALVTILAVGFGGSSNKKNAASAAKTEDTTRPAIDQPPTPDPATATQPAPPAAEGSAQALAAQPSEAEQAEAANAEQARIAAEQEQAKQAEAAKAEAAKAEQLRIEAEKKAEEQRLAAEQKATEQRLAAEKKAEAQRQADAKKAEQARIAAEKKAEQQRLAEAKKAEQAKKADAAKTAPKALAKTAAKPAATKPAPLKPEPVKTAGKVDAETAYRAGLQQFARGDTSGALASLRSALAANPSYAPTWRGLGLVFEKMGEKDQARAAYKRYLQLAPSAGDTDQIRSRLERLGS